MQPLSPQVLRPLILQALREDVASRDATSRAVIPPGLRIRARIVSKAPGVAAGIELAALVFTTLDPSLRCALTRRDGARLAAGDVILTVEGRARSVLAAERTALNLLGHLSGIATLTHAFVRLVQGTPARIFDTRKTLPGLRALEKYAVRVGGGCNHRFGLHDAVLIKTNHLKALGQGARGKGRGEVIRLAIRDAKQRHPRKAIEVEVGTWAAFEAALAMKPDIIMLDNWPLGQMRRAVRLRTPPPPAPRPPPLLEVSGGVTLANVRAIARTGVDRISIGRLTHSAPSLDVALDVLE